MATPSRIKELLKKGSEEAVRKTGTSFEDLSQAKKKELYQNVAGGATKTEMINKGFTRTQIARATENIRTAKGDKGAETLKKAAERGAKRTAEKAKRAEKAARETVVQTGSVGTKSVSKKPSIAVGRFEATMADASKRRLKESKEVGRDAKGTMQYETVTIPKKDNRPSRAQQLAQGKKPPTKSESARKGATTRKETTARMERAASKAMSDGDIDAYYDKLPGGKKQQIMQSASLSSDPEQRKRTLVMQLMKDEGITAAELAKNYKKGGIAMKGKK
jgi:hypothetical protein